MMMMDSVVVVGLSLLSSLLLLSSFSQFVVVVGGGGDDAWNLDEDDDGWIDPHSMIYDQPVLNKKANDDSCSRIDTDCSVIEQKVTECARKVEKLQKHLEEQKELYRKTETVAVKEQPFFKQYLQKILSLFKNYKTNIQNGQYKADITLSSIGYGYVVDYVAYQNVSVQEVHHVLSSMITNVQWISEEFDIDENARSAFFFSSEVIHCLNVIALGLVIMAAALHAVSMLRKINVSPCRFLFLILFFLTVASFVISIPWTWWHLYKKKVAHRMALIVNGPVECTSQATNLYRTIASIFVVQSDRCQKYIEAMEIDPLWEVPPTQAVAVTLTRFFLEPAGYIGRAIREFMVSAFEGLPISLWIPVYVLIVLLLVLTMFCWGGYRIYTPLLRIEPMQHGGSSADQLTALQRQVHQLQNRNEELERDLNEQGNRTVALEGAGDRQRGLGIAPAVESVSGGFPDVAIAGEESRDKENVIREGKPKELSSDPEEKCTPPPPPPPPPPPKNNTKGIGPEVETSDPEKLNRCEVIKTAALVATDSKSELGDSPKNDTNGIGPEVETSDPEKLNRCKVIKTAALVATDSKSQLGNDWVEIPQVESLHNYN